ncbi:MAG TPA: hypothetical protein VHA53_01705 [Nitrolancea sp.]|nr:hypothetical protein [Nitrolancea sp.]
MMYRSVFHRLAVALAIFLFLGCGEIDPVGSATEGTAAASRQSPAAAATAGSLTSTLCGTIGYPFFPDVSGIDEFAWASEQIVVGTVTQQLPSVWSEPLTIGMEEQTGGVSRSIRTDYVVTVQARLRGVPTDTVTVATEGGTIGDCTIRNPESGTLTIGEHVLLFLTRPADVRTTQPAGATMAYVLVGGQAGILRVLDTETVAPAIDPSARHPYRDLANSVLSALHTSSPPDGMNLPAVPLADGPAATTIEPLSAP